MESSLKELAGYRLANALKSFDSSKHSGVIAYFTKEYLKTEILDRSLAVIIKESSFCREKSDYDDFMWRVKSRRKSNLKKRNTLFSKWKIMST